MLRAISIFWILLSVLMLAVAYSGHADAWLQPISSCGADGETARACRNGEIAHVLVLCGWISLAAGVLELMFMSKIKDMLSY
jgi:hypothetical protein